MVRDATAGDLLAATARWTAAVRATESERDDGLYRDPWAEALAGLEGMAWVRERPPESVLPIVLRTRYFDDWLETVASDGIRQVVLLGAGLDTRAFRLRWPPDMALFEVDRPLVLNHKAEVLHRAGARPACLRRTVGADLTQPWADRLIEAGFDPGRPSAWLLEGFLFYLPVDAVARLLDDLAPLACGGSRLGFDIVNGAMLTSPWTRPWIEMQARAGAPWIGTMDDPVAELALRGWRAHLTQAGQPDASHGRWTLPVIPTDMPGMPHNWFVTAVRAP